MTGGELRRGLQCALRTFRWHAAELPPLKFLLQFFETRNEEKVLVSEEPDAPLQWIAMEIKTSYASRSCSLSRSLFAIAERARTKALIFF